MTESVTGSNKLQMKWIVNSFLAYVIFYLLPITAICYAVNGGPIPYIALTFLGVWLFAGVIIIAAVVGYLSEGITIIEPAIGGAVTAFIFFDVLMLLIRRDLLRVKSLIGILGIIIAVFVLSLFGAWLGEKLQAKKEAKKAEAA